MAFLLRFSLVVHEDDAYHLVVFLADQIVSELGEYSDGSPDACDAFNSVKGRHLNRHLSTANMPTSTFSNLNEYCW